MRETQKHDKGAKRKHFDDDTEHVNGTDREKKKKQKVVAKTRTLTLKPHNLSYPNVPTSNRFIPNQYHHHTKSKSSSIIDCNRKWVFSDTDVSAHKDRIVFVSYNILGVENASKHPDLYLKIPPEYLEWDWRKELICNEINHYNADILCFQEVDHFNDLNCLLQEDGFRGVYKGRTGEACDGCAIFWKDTLFSLLHEENLEFQSFGLRNNVAQLCVLKMNKNQSKSDQLMQSSEARCSKSQRFVVGNVHVLFNPNRGDIKLGQVRLFLERAYNLSQKWGGIPVIIGGDLNSLPQVRLFLERAYNLSQKWGGIPVIIGGDLNSLPQSAMYQFMASSELNILVHDRRNISGQLEHPPQHKYYRSMNAKSDWMSTSRSSMHVWSNEQVMLATGNEGVAHLRHQLKLSSAYLGVPGSRRSRDNLGEPLATSYHSKFMGTVDYIWHTEELIPVRVLETLPVDVLRRSAGLPNEKWGSDHLALVCELAFAN